MKGEFFALSSQFKIPCLKKWCGKKRHEWKEETGALSTSVTSLIVNDITTMGADTSVTSDSSCGSASGRVKDTRICVCVCECVQRRLWLPTVFPSVLFRRGYTFEQPCSKTPWCHTQSCCRTTSGQGSLAGYRDTPCLTVRRILSSLVEMWRCLENW